MIKSLGLFAPAKSPAEFLKPRDTADEKTYLGIFWIFKIPPLVVKGHSSLVKFSERVQWRSFSLQLQELCF
jgi:hypothetical protein